MMGQRIKAMQGMEGARRATGIPCMAGTAQGVPSLQILSAAAEFNQFTDEFLPFQTATSISFSKKSFDGGRSSSSIINE